MSGRGRLFQAIVATAALLGAWTQARADDLDLPTALALQEPKAAAGAPPQAPQEPDRKWRFDFALYLWMADLSGDLTVGNFAIDAESDFGDVVEDVQIAGTLHFEAWSKNRIGILADFNWMVLEDDLEIGPAEGTVRQTVGITEADFAYRLAEQEVSLDLIVGLRWIYLETDVNMGSLGEAEKSKSYLDPVIGMRVTWEPLESLYFSLRADVGGFNVGTDASGNVAAYAGYRFSEMFALLVGYRALGLEIEEDGHVLHLNVSGPVLAFDIGF